MLSSADDVVNRLIQLVLEDQQPLLGDHITELHTAIVQLANQAIADIVPLLTTEVVQHLASGALTDTQAQTLYSVVFNYVADSLRDAADAARAGAPSNG